MKVEFRTVIEIPHPPFFITPSSRLMFLGSCFSNAIGKRFIENRLNAVSNPFGTLYNPDSIWQLLRMIGKGNHDFSPYLFKKEELWFSWLHSTAFYNKSRQLLLEQLRHDMEKTDEYFRQTDVLFITWGTNRYYTLANQEQCIVSNCHKCPSDTFQEHQATVEDITSMGKEVISEIIQYHPQIRFVITISPYRYRKYGFHGNQLAKATLLLAADHLAKIFPDNIWYFPAYEIVLDELRDYRFYADDNLHISNQAEEYIWERVKDILLDKDTLHMMQRWDSIRKRIQHQPMNPQSESYRSFLQTLVKDISLFGKDYPHEDIECYLNDLKKKTNYCL